jgi:hypothetical protein
LTLASKNGVGSEGDDRDDRDDRVDDLEAQVDE